MIGYLLIGIGVALAAWLYIAASYRLDEKEAEMFRAWREREQRRAAHHVITRSIYDHERRGDLR